MKPTFACVLKSGGDYFPEHVQALAEQVDNNTTIEYEFVCYSDVPIPGVKTVDLIKGYPGWWSVPEVFRQKGPTIVTGIDTVINRNIDELFKIALESNEKEFWMIKAFNPNNDFASGIMAYNGDWSCIWDEFNYDEAIKKHSSKGRKIGGEQDHTKEVLARHGVKPKALQDVFPGIVSYKRHCKRHGVPKNARVILFHGLPRPWEVPGMWNGNKKEVGKIEERWPDSTVYILGGGPSLTDMNLESLDGKNVLGVNQAYKITRCTVPVTYSGDRRWYNWNIKQLPHYKGTLYTSFPNFIPNQRYIPINVGRMSRNGISDKSRSSICWNNNSGASAINVAYWLGARRVVLLGFDMGRRGKQFNWHNDYPSTPRIDTRTGRPTNSSSYRKFLKCWDQVAIDAKRLGIEIINATPAGNLNKFPRVKLEDTL